MIKYLKNEKALIFSLIFLVVLFPFKSLIEASNFFSLITFFAIFCLIIYSAMWVAHHAEKLAKKYWEPYWTIVLTISAVTVEVIIIWIMMSNAPDNNVTLARDIIVSALMLDLAWLAWLAIFIWWITYWTQKYNVDSSNTYLLIIFVSVVAAMVIPDFLPKELIKSYNYFLVVIYAVMIYVFYKFQTITHSWFFRYKNAKLITDENIKKKIKKINGLYHIVWLISLIIVIWLMAEFLSIFMNKQIVHYSIPIWLWALAVAIIAASPEFMTAIKAAKRNQMQTVINISFWASVATVLLTIPVMIILAWILWKEMELWLTALQALLLWIVLIWWMLAFWDWKVNKLEWLLFLVIFFIYIFLMVSWVFETV